MQNKVILMSDDMSDGSLEVLMLPSAPQHPILPTEHIKLLQVKL